ncbi:MAG: hypothetical protein KDE22_12810, partial [Rhodobacterales bacterium]|nr:hypothetical protein [Rhodobacterales bacterium]
TSDWSGLAEHAARSIDPDDPKTTAVARDLVDRISQDFGPDKAGAFMKHAVGYLTPDQYEALVDGSPNPGPPVGTPVATLMTETVAYQPNPSSGGTSGGQLGSLNQAATPMKVSAGSVQAPAPAGTASQRPPRQIDPAWTDRQKQTHETLWFLADRGKTQGRPVASNLLRQYLEGSGAPITLEADFVRKHPPTQEAMRRAERHFEEWLRGERGDKTFGEIRDWIQNNKPTQTIKAMKWDGQAYPGFDLSGSDQSLSLGQYTIQGIGDLTLTQKGDKVVVRGRIGHRLNDKYDFQEGKQGKKAGFLSNLATVPVGLANHDIGLTRNAIIDYERVAGAKGFPLRSKPWYRELVGVLTIKNGKVVKSHFQWRSVK